MRKKKRSSRREGDNSYREREREKCIFKMIRVYGRLTKPTPLIRFTTRADNSNVQQNSSRRTAFLRA